jgi:hypothetical protein
MRIPSPLHALELIGSAFSFVIRTGAAAVSRREDAIAVAIKERLTGETLKGPIELLLSVKVWLPSILDGTSQ